MTWILWLTLKVDGETVVEMVPINYTEKQCIVEANKRYSTRKYAGCICVEGIVVIIK